MLTGYVTRAASASDFDVNGARILCNGTAGDSAGPPRDLTIAVAKCPSEAPRLGESFAIRYAAQNTAKPAIYATRIDKQHSSSLGRVSGSAVIDALPDAKTVAGTPNDFTFRADGYRIRITADTKSDWSLPLLSRADARAGNWIQYKGKIDAAGVLIASYVQVGPNAIGDGERKLRTKNEYDPSAVPADAKQDYLKDGFTASFDPRRFPPYKDAALQARIERIGNSLIPAYQRELPAPDPAKVDFRFQLIDTKKLDEAFALPSGIILVPHRVAERTQNDSQLAAVLADGIARVVERQPYRLEGKIKASRASILTSAIPYVGFGGGVGFAVGREIEEKATEQRSRVSLCLLHDTGYDIAQAPIVWWFLAAEKAKPISDIEIPDRATHLYRILEGIWRDAGVPAPSVHESSLVTVRAGNEP